MEDLLTGAVSDKARAFAAELQALCVKHGIQLAVSGYDSIQLWPLKEGEAPIYALAIEDKTGERA